MFVEIWMRWSIALSSAFYRGRQYLWIVFSFKTMHALSWRILGPEEYLALCLWLKDLIITKFVHYGTWTANRRFVWQKKKMFSINQIIDLKNKSKRMVIEKVRGHAGISLVFTMHLLWHGTSVLWPRLMDCPICHALRLENYTKDWFKEKRKRQQQQQKKPNNNNNKQVLFM